MKTAIVAFYQVYPPASGAAAVSFNLAKFLGGERLLVQAAPDSELDEIAGVRLVSVRAALGIGKLAGLRGRIAAMVREILRFRPDAIVLEGASWAVYHLALMRALRKSVPAARLIYHSHNVEYLLRARRNGRAIAALTRWAEGRLLREADLCTAVSSIDRDLFKHVYGVRPILLPNGVDVDRFGSVSAARVARMRREYRIDAHTVLFSGFYSYPPNREAVDFLVRSVMPALRERCPAARLALSGGGAPHHADWIRNLGSVPYGDFPAMVAGCGLAAAPIFSGSGTRLKIVEAMAAGLPVVATAKAAEGLGLRHREHFLVANDQQEFVDAVGLLLRDPLLVRCLRTSARRKVEAEFSWRRIAREFEAALHRLCGTSGFKAAEYESLRPLLREVRPR